MWCVRVLYGTVRDICETVPLCRGSAEEEVKLDVRVCRGFNEGDIWIDRRKEFEWME